MNPELILTLSGKIGRVVGSSKSGEFKTLDFGDSSSVYHRSELVSASSRLTVNKYERARALMKAIGG